jgi:uncharacterized protein (TIGR03435 family)
MLRRVVTLLTMGAAALLGQSSPEPLPAFEAASVRLTPPASLGYTTFSPYGTGRYTATNATLDSLVQIAYGVPYQQISGIEKLGSEHYDLTAKAEDGVLLTYEQLQPRLRRLLEERFKLAIHRERKDFDGYALVVAKAGPKLQPTTGSSESGAIYPGGLRVMNMPLSSFAGVLRSPAGRPVIDKTGIAGSYDFTLAYARDGDTDSALPSFFTALQEQFGLKLEAAKVPLEVVVIDRVEKVPDEN